MKPAQVFFRAFLMLVLMGLGVTVIVLVLQGCVLEAPGMMTPSQPACVILCFATITNARAGPPPEAASTPKATDKRSNP
jgi:hypothetical protein